MAKDGNWDIEFLGALQDITDGPSRTFQYLYPSNLGNHEKGQIWIEREMWNDNFRVETTISRGFYIKCFGWENRSCGAYKCVWIGIGRNLNAKRSCDGFFILLIVIKWSHISYAWSGVSCCSACNKDLVSLFAKRETQTLY